MAEDITHDGVAARDKHDIAAEGPTRVIYDEITLGTYDASNDGTGNTFDPGFEYGFSRLGIVHCEVVAASYEAQYDYQNNSIRVYNLSDGTEVAQGTTLDISIRIEVRGMGA